MEHDGSGGGGSRVLCGGAPLTNGEIPSFTMAVYYKKIEEDEDEKNCDGIPLRDDAPCPGRMR
jgi:hypothetical protein